MYCTVHYTVGIMHYASPWHTRTLPVHSKGRPIFDEKIILNKSIPRIIGEHADVNTVR
jgi:hypothetical protein